MVRQEENRKGYQCLVYVAAYTCTSGTIITSRAQVFYLTIMFCSESD